MKDKNMKDKNMKCLVISGGGSKGAFTGGMLEYMKLIMGKEYDLYISTSTGTLLQSLASINDFVALKEGYTSIEIDDIYKINPFSSESTSDKTKINIMNAVRMYFLEHEPTLGDSSNLKGLIKKFFPKEKYIKSLENGKKLISCVTNLTKIQSEYYSSTELGIDGYDEFCDWTWISCNAVPFTSLVRRGIDNDYYADGGFMEHMPICKAILEGATEIDAISTMTEFYTPEPLEIGRNPLTLISRLFDVFLRNAAQIDIDKARELAKDRDIVLNIYYVPRVLTENSLFFDKKLMSSWWDEGYNHIKTLNESDNDNCKVIMLNKNIKTK